METKKCKGCGRELPLNNYQLSRNGMTRISFCKECMSKRVRVGMTGTVMRTNFNNYSDPEFDGKQPVEVLQLMKRAKMWLEAQGYNITLKGTYTKVIEVKF